MKRLRSRLDDSTLEENTPGISEENVELMTPSLPTLSASAEAEREPQNGHIGWGYRFRKSGTEAVATVWIKQGIIFCDLTNYARLRPPEIVNWMDFVEGSRIDGSNNDTYGHVNSKGSSHGFVEETGQGGDVVKDIGED